MEIPLKFTERGSHCVCFTRCQAKRLRVLNAKESPLDAESDRGKKGLQGARREASGSLEDTKVFPLLKKNPNKPKSFVEEVL